jgi:hypothetical protein
MKKFAIGFAIGIGLMYWYLENSSQLFNRGEEWMNRSASGYRGDRVHDAARNVLDEGRD